MVSLAIVLLKKEQGRYANWNCLQKESLIAKQVHHFNVKQLACVFERVYACSVGRKSIAVRVLNSSPFSSHVFLFYRRDGGRANPELLPGSLQPSLCTLLPLRRSGSSSHDSFRLGVSSAWFLSIKLV